MEWQSSRLFKDTLPLLSNSTGLEIGESIQGISVSHQGYLGTCFLRARCGLYFPKGHGLFFERLGS